ncbi:MAG: UDP-N-acetylglucosamine--N-acetylmuramyl-(pentapeptide) pyrophosphoryl-undecaprenol N-acetylglucosamine transferase [Candidatus Pacebacteria bacterium]|nr:UDP-N-acetylglucosamine--N-acetylmuramyl-(pentapeptide) pyrophosphoryl-undecaprenol N-acetylglucosamine transferase [Candidatus Paceibacterota bacterium]
MRVLFTSGNTGGHLYPILAVKRELDKCLNFLETKYGKILPKEFLTRDYLFLGGDLKGKETMLQEEDIETKKIISIKWRRYFSFQNFLDVLKTPFSFLQASFLIWSFMPDIVFSKGGPGSFAVVIASWLYRIPVVIHESDSVPGKTNKFSAPFAKKITVSFKGGNAIFKKNKVVFTGHPVRQMLTNGSKERAKEMFNLTGERKVILIMGGSQGAQQINLVFLDAFYKYIKDYEIIHICGQKNFKETNLLTSALLKKEQKKFYHLYPSLGEDKIKEAYAITDLVISRAGAGSLFEIAALKKPNIIIPLENSAGDHQQLNAQIFGEKGCGIVIEAQNISPNIVYITAKDLLEREEQTKKIINACKKFYKPDAAQKIAETIIETV